MKALRLAGEFAVIVLGVLVALFMESAWEDRQEEALAREYLERLREETGVNREQIDFDLAFSTFNCEASEAAYAGLAEAGSRVAADGEAGSRDLLRVLWGAALNRTGNSYRTSTYEDLLASGRLGLIENAELRDRIIAFYEYDLDDWRPSREDTYRRTVLRTLPPTWTTAMTRACTTIDELREDWRTCWAPVEGGPARWVDRIASVPGVLEALADRTYTACNFPRFLSEADTRLAALEAGLGMVPDAVAGS